MTFKAGLLDGRRIAWTGGGGVAILAQLRRLGAWVDSIGEQVLLDEPFADCCARAGSWPLTSVTAINSQTATNSATVLATTRRRINRTRAIRACLAVGVEAILQCRIRRVRSSRMRER